MSFVSNQHAASFYEFIPTENWCLFQKIAALYFRWDERSDEWECLSYTPHTVCCQIAIGNCTAGCECIYTVILFSRISQTAGSDSVGRNWFNTQINYNCRTLFYSVVSFPSMAFIQCKNARVLGMSITYWILSEKSNKITTSFLGSSLDRCVCKCIRYSPTDSGLVITLREISHKW